MKTSLSLSLKLQFVFVLFWHNISLVLNFLVHIEFYEHKVTIA